MKIGLQNLAPKTISMWTCFSETAQLKLLKISKEYAASNLFERLPKLRIFFAPNFECDYLSLWWEQSLK
jgi:hypothetical protein